MTMRYLTLEMCKKQVYVDYDEDDAMIELQAAAAEDVIEQNLNRKLEDVAVDGKLPSAIMQAMLLFFGALYANREGFSTMASQPTASMIALLQPYKRYGN